MSAKSGSLIFARSPVRPFAVRRPPHSRSESVGGDMSKRVPPVAMSKTALERVRVRYLHPARSRGAGRDSVEGDMIDMRPIA
jgi:hypothetical protein